MQTFLPYPDFEKSLKCLDTKRAGKQRAEAWQIYNVITKNGKAWRNHPCTNMCRKYPNALALYYNISLTLWENRGYKNIKLKPISICGEIIMPNWLGNVEFHISHQSNLLRKKPEYYKQFFNVNNNLPYIWPLK